MKRRYLLLPVVAGALIAGSMLASASAGGSAQRFHRIDVKGVDPALRPAALDASQKVNVVLELRGASVAQHERIARRQGQRLSAAERAAIRASLAASQESVKAGAERAGASVKAQFQDAINGIRVQAPAAALAKLRAIPGVAALRSVHTFTRDNTRSATFIGTPAAWGDLGVTGKGVTVAVIDTGIDYYHADFGGSGKVADFQADDGLTTDTTDSNGNVAFPDAKVVGGTDFVGDAYDASSDDPAARIPHPDPDPLDCDPARGTSVGHGTHTAGTAAGDGVLADGTTFHGPYDANTISANSFEVGPGMAPEASILAYRVFGCNGSTDVVVDAINRAVADGADVINMSLGSPFGGPDSSEAAAIKSATAAGVVVVASAGNEGGNAYTQGSPASSTEALSVAAVDAIDTFDSGNVALAGGTVVPTINANQATIGTITAPLTVLSDGAGGIGLGCAAADYAGTAGKVVVTLRGVCARIDRATLGQAAGAAAVIMVNNAADFPPLEGPIPGVTIPFLGARPADATALRAADGQTVTITAGPALANPGFKRVATFSSGGPRFGDSAVKPDVAAPGVSVKSAFAASGTKGQLLSGTSMASPMAAGVAALVTQRHPDWSTARIKAAISNTASPAALAAFNLRIAGAGLIRPRLAADTDVTAVADDDTPSLSFKYQQLGGAFSATKTLTFTNSGASPVTYDLANAFNGGSLGATVSVSPASVMVPAGGTATTAVTVSLSAAAVAALPGAEAGPGVLAQIVRGLITATPAAPGPPTLTIPLVLVPRGTSEVRSDAAVTKQGGNLVADVALSNQGVHAGNADVYAWGLRDAREGDPLVDVRDVGVQTFPDPASNDGLLVFAINTFGRFSNASAAEFDIAIDTNRDGNADFFVVGADIGAVLAGDDDGRYGSFIFDAAGNLIDAFFADAPMNGSTILLPAAFADLGLTTKSSEFTYSLALAFNRNTGTTDDVGGVARFNAFDPNISTGDFVSLAPGATAGLTLTAERGKLNGVGNRFAGSPPLGWLVVSLDNANGADQAAHIPIDIH